MLLAGQAPFAVAGAIWLDPARATLGYGQVDILLALAVVGLLALALAAWYRLRITPGAAVSGWEP